MPCNTSSSLVVADLGLLNFRVIFSPLVYWRDDPFRFSLCRFSDGYQQQQRPSMGCDRQPTFWTGHQTYAEERGRENPRSFWAVGFIRLRRVGVKRRHKKSYTGHPTRYQNMRLRLF